MTAKELKALITIQEWKVRKETEKLERYKFHLELISRPKLKVLTGGKI